MKAFKNLTTSPTNLILLGILLGITGGTGVLSLYGNVSGRLYEATSTLLLSILISTTGMYLTAQGFYKLTEQKKA